MDQQRRGNEMEETIRSEVEKAYLQPKIDQLIRDVVQGELGESLGVDEDAVVGQLLDSTAVQSLIGRLSLMNQKSKELVPSAINVPQNIRDQVLAGRRYLYLNLIGGRAFIDHLGVSSSSHLHQSSFLVHVALPTQRFQTHPIRCECDPQISEGFLFDLQQLRPDHARILDGLELLSLSAPVSVVVVKEGHQGAKPTLVSAHTLEWRSLITLPLSRNKFVCQLMGIGAEQQVPVGLLDIEAALVPPIEKVIPHESFMEHLHNTETCHGEKRRLFVSYTRAWWQEYKEASEKHGKRIVRIFAMDECGQNRFVCEFVRVVRVDQALKSPKEAARWISVLPTSFHQLPAGATKPWYTLHTAVMAGSLSIESKCSLLCSLLLGFGLDAWICAGRRQSGQPHVWVMTRGPYAAITFWEAATGSRYLHKIGQHGGHGYATIGSVFNNKTFYANCQVTDKIQYCSFVLEDATLWKKMSHTATSSIVEKEICHLDLISPKDNGDERRINMEIQLKVLIMEHRKDKGLSSHFDEHLSYVLAPALWSYERESIDGGTQAENRDAEFFSAALMNTVAEGYTFKGFPLHFTHCSPRRAFSAILSSSIGREIIECRGDCVTLAVRAVTTCYPENVFVTWVIVACTFRQLG